MVSMQKKSIVKLSKFAVPLVSKGRFIPEKKTDLRMIFKVIEIELFIQLHLED